MKFLIVCLLLFIFIKSYQNNHIRVGHNHLSIFFGVPGCGKTTLASIYAYKYLKHGFNVYSNVPIKGCYSYSPLDDLGVNDVQGLVIIDEAALDYNNRKFKSMPQHNIEWFKLHRHYHCEVLVFSQSWCDCDVTLRRLAYQYFIVRPGIIPFTVQAVPIRRKIGIDEVSKQPNDIYSFYPWLIAPFKIQTYFVFKARKMFDSWDAPELKTKDYSVYGDYILSYKESRKKFSNDLKNVISGMFKKKKIEEDEEND